MLYSMYNLFVVGVEDGTVSFVIFGKTCASILTDFLVGGISIIIV